MNASAALTLACIPTGIVLAYHGIALADTARDTRHFVAGFVCMFLGSALVFYANVVLETMNQ